MAGMVRLGQSNGGIFGRGTTAGYMDFFDALESRIDGVDSVVSVGLDPDPDRLPPFLDADMPRWAFNRRVIDATHEHAACYKPNAAFYEDSQGWRALKETIVYAHGKGVPVLLDAKRGDIGNTARQYASALDDGLGADAITVNPYLGRDTLEPYLSRSEKRSSFSVERPTAEVLISRISMSAMASCSTSTSHSGAPNGILTKTSASPTTSVSSTPRGGSSSPEREPTAKMPTSGRSGTRPGDYNGV